MVVNAKIQINQQSLAGLHYATIGICFLMNMFDGMDVSVISYAAPAISKDWQVSPEAFGAVFSSSLFGMAFGSLVIAPYADKVGRKAMILLSATIISLSIYFTAQASDIESLIAFRFLSGVGIGSMLASTAALAAEYSPGRTKNFWVSFVIAGYPVGAVLAGLVAARLIPQSGWQVLFHVAGIATFFAIPLILFFLTESLEFYLKAQPRHALLKANLILERMGQETLQTLPTKSTNQHSTPLLSILGKGDKRPTIQLWLAFLLAFATLYFLTSWIPKLASNAGLSIELAIYAGTVFNGGAFFGIITQGYISTRVGLKKTISVFMIVTGLLMISFHLFHGSPLLLLIFGLLGFCLQGGFVGLYAVATQLYPTEYRTSGVGWAIGVGRLGGIIGTAIGGVLIETGVSMGINFIIYALPVLMAGVITLRISSPKLE